MLWNLMVGWVELIGERIAAGCGLRDRSSMTVPQPPSSSSALPLPQEPDELTKFRDNWKHEVGLHHRAAVTREFSVDSIPPAGGLPAAVTQHYSAEELPQAQDSFVSPSV